MSGAARSLSDQDFRASLIDALGTIRLPEDEIEAFADAVMMRHPSVLRYRWGDDPGKLDIPVAPIPWYQLGFQCTDPALRPSRTLDYAAGAFFLQDAGSLLALAAVDADEPSTSKRLICDLCAAPGGKASGMLESIGDGFLLANEPIKSRLAPLAYNLARTGSDRYTISSLDPETLAARLGGVFDVVMADVPCSGQALLGRGKQNTAAVSKTQIEHSAMRARRILASAIQLVRPGGQLVLSTCTFAEQENESQVRWLLDNHDVSPQRRDRLSPYLSDDTECSYRLWPHRDGCAGSFTASLRCDAARPLPQTTSTSRRAKVKQREPLPKDLASWFESLPNRYQVSGAVIWSWPEDAPAWVESISARGPELAYRNGQTWKPSHESAIRRCGVVRGSGSVEVDGASAKQYLIGQPIACAASGWRVVRYQGQPLGWVKASRGTGKNHLPGAARLEVE